MNIQRGPGPTILAACLTSAVLSQGLPIMNPLVSQAAMIALQAAAPGDFDADADSDVDLRDWSAFQNCLAGSGPGTPEPLACLSSDVDNDNDIDLADTASFQVAFTGSYVCGDSRVQPGEQCDDGNTTPGDGCSPTCQNEPTGIPNDNCAHPIAVSEGVVQYSNVGGTTDGRDEPLDCNYFGSSQIFSDIWYCYTAACTGPAVISLCGSAYDTKLAVYAGCDCPSARPLACSDDDCGTAIDHEQSRVTIDAVAGASYLVRVGGYLGNQEQGQGLLTIRCGEDTCNTSTLSCTTNHGANNPGCNDSNCCNSVCQVDTACCDVSWSAFCAAEAGGFCSGSGFATCNPNAGACDHNHNGPGCSNVNCCNAVCQAVPQCCISKWDGDCVAQFDLLCTYCGPGRGACDAARPVPGCENVACCADVCSVDPFCCTQEWDLTCAQEAGALCEPN